MKTYNDVKIGDTVYIWGNDDLCVRETKVTQKHYDGYHWCLKFSNKCLGYALKKWYFIINGYVCSPYIL